MSGMLLIISGPSGVGKTTITHGVERGFADAVFSVSVTTRPMTDADTEGVDYHFVDDAAFDAMRERGELLEWAEVFGRKYGTPRRPVEEALAAGRLMILEIDVRGAEQVKQRLPDAYGIFVLPPSLDELLARLRRRQRENEERIQGRFREAQREMAEAKSCGAYDVFIVNDDLERATREAIAVVRGERARRGSWVG